MRRGAIRGVTLIAALLAACRRPGPASKKGETPHSPARITSGQGLDAFAAFSPDGRSIAYCSDRSGSFEVYVRSIADGRETAVTGDGRQNFEPSWSPDGKRIVYHSKGRGGLWIVPAEGGPPESLTDFGSRPAWSPDGKEIAFQSQSLVDFSATTVAAVPPSTIWTVSARGGSLQNLTREGSPPGGHGNPVWSEDGRLILFVTTDPRNTTAELWSVSKLGGETTPLLTAPRIDEPVLAPDGRTLYFGGFSPDSKRGLFRVPLASGRPSGNPALFLVRDVGVPRHLTVSADGRRVAFSLVTTAGHLVTLPVSPAGEATGPPRPLTHEDGRATWPFFSPDGGRIGFNRISQGSSDVWVMDADGTHAAQVTTAPGDDYLGDFFPGGDRLIFLSDRTTHVTLFTIGLADRKAVPLHVSDRELGSPRLSPDGRRIAFNSKIGGVTINTWVLDIASGRSTQLTVDRQLLGFPCWSPDGKTLALQARRGNDVHIVLMPSEGGTPEQLTDEPGLSWHFSWSPDGDKVAFAGFRKGFWNVWWVSRSTKEQRKLTSYEKVSAYVRSPAWSPAGNQIVYEYAETIGNLWTVDVPE